MEFRSAIYSLLVDSGPTTDAQSMTKHLPTFSSVLTWNCDSLITTITLFIVFINFYLPSVEHLNTVDSVARAAKLESPRVSYVNIFLEGRNTERNLVAMNLLALWQDAGRGMYKGTVLGERWCLSGRVWCLASGGLQVQISLYPPFRDLGQVLHSQLSVALRRIYSDTVSIL